jgi:hypothetical protein
MTAITIPASMKPLFGQLSEPVSVQDEQGNVLGFYTPVTQASKEDYEWAKKQFTAEELQRSRASGIAGTTDEVLRKIGAR